MSVEQICTRDDPRAMNETQGRDRWVSVQQQCVIMRLWPQAWIPMLSGWHAFDLMPFLYGFGNQVFLAEVDT